MYVVKALFYALVGNSKGFAAKEDEFEVSSTSL